MPTIIEMNNSSTDTSPCSYIMDGMLTGWHRQRGGLQSYVDRESLIRNLHLVRARLEKLVVHQARTTRSCVNVLHKAQGYLKWHY